MIIGPDSEARGGKIIDFTRVPLAVFNMKAEALLDE